MFEEYCYVGYKRDLNSKTKIVKFNEVEIDDITEHYQTIYRFTESIKEHGSIRDISSSDTFFCDYLCFDIDRRSVGEAVRDTVKLVDFLNNYEIYHETWFSGSKGFHILISTYQFGFEPTNNELVLKNMAVAIANKVGIEIDTSIYNASRVLRMPFSIHRKTKKKKMPVQSFQDGKYVLCDTNENPFNEPEDCVHNDILVKLYKGSLEHSKKITKPTIDCPVSVSSVFAPAKEGERNQGCFKRAKILRERKFTQDDALRALLLWNNGNDAPLTQDEIKRTVISAWRGDVNYLDTDKNSTMDFFSAKKSINQILDRYKDFDKSVTRTGYGFFDKYTLGLMPGDIIFWLAVNGNFKTCVLSNILQKATKTTGKYSLYFSMDMSADSLQMRHMQHAEKMTLSEVYKNIRKGYRFPKFEKLYNKVFIIDTKSPTVEQVSGFIEWFQNNKGPIGMIGYDYLGAFKGCDNDTKKTADTVHAISAASSELGVCPSICLVQARREYEGRGGNCEIDKTAGKDASAIEHKADFVIGSWWHEREGEERKYWGRFLKHRKFDSENYKQGAYFSLDFEPKYMDLLSVKHEENHPKFIQKVRYGNG